MACGARHDVKTWRRRISSVAESASAMTEVRDDTDKWVPLVYEARRRGHGESKGGALRGWAWRGAGPQGGAGLRGLVAGPNRGERKREFSFSILFSKPNSIVNQMQIQIEFQIYFSIQRKVSKFWQVFQK